MAITLSVNLTDAEQAKMVEMIQTIEPGLTAAQMKAWAEKAAKRALRHEIVQLYRHEQQRQLETVWADDYVPPVYPPPPVGGA
jgi:hypothetical protein